MSPNVQHNVFIIPVAIHFEGKKNLTFARNEIDALMGKYVGQEHTMYLKVCNVAGNWRKIHCGRETVLCFLPSVRQKVQRRTRT